MSPRVTKQTLRSKKRVGKTRSAWDLSDKVKANLYGRSGSGKTTLWATFPKPILALICSGGATPGELKSIDSPANRKNIKAEIVEDSADVASLLETAKDYRTVVLDHASGLQDMYLKEILGLSELPAQKGWGLASREQYGQCSLQTKETLRTLLSLDNHLVIVAQEREFNTDGDEELLMPYVGSALMPSVINWLGPAVDYMAQTFIRAKTKVVEIKVGKSVQHKQQRTGGVEYCLRVGPHDVFMTKFRTPGRSLPDVIVNPTYEKIVKLIEGTSVK